jgi:hypothetical protein
MPAWPAGAPGQDQAGRRRTRPAVNQEQMSPRMGMPASVSRPSPGGACRRDTARPGGRRDAAMAAGHRFPDQGACTSGSRQWFPSLRLAFQKDHLAAQTWWAQQGSNLWLLACKAEYGTEYAQLIGSVHAPELRKQCPEMPWGAWESLHGGSREWFPEQPADPSLMERVRAWRHAYRSRTRRMAGTPVIAIGLDGNHYGSEHRSVTLESSCV